MKDRTSITQARNDKVGMRSGSYYVAPRYAGGSPALVDGDTAIAVAVDEAQAIERHVEGVHGEESKTRAQKLGLANIVYFRWSKGKKTFRYDLLTETVIEEPKRLDYHQIEEAHTLRRHKQFIGDLKEADARRLTQLEEAAALHRQAIA